MDAFTSQKLTVQLLQYRMYYLFVFLLHMCSGTHAHHGRPAYMCAMLAGSLADANIVRGFLALTPSCAFPQVVL
ncbi:hypothetical protein PYCCODRAFT_1429426 [Trametes coccinea BRFM310]|uniref:Uncharacterized protein n=1 Tax=Trametes coccinea (strain BRFM310) TaxID=1353009 RepID=A0A1Y2J6E6_TRAC3|nr:hypothetical protein PYCCODRAFT_1429426 [Trametes coccinea BRFM310]